jgi:hypothetical protein
VWSRSFASSSLARKRHAMTAVPRRLEAKPV